MPLLEQARRLGFLGPPPVEAHITHALGFVRAWDTLVSAAGRPPAGDVVRVLDLGSGGGVPGLVVALALPRTTLTLLDAAERRSAFLRDAVATLGLVGRVTVLRARAEEAGRDPAHRAMYDLVTARAFGAPAVTAECGAPFLGPGGALLVSEPPDAVAGRWPAAGLAELGLRAGALIGRDPAVQVLERAGPLADRFPRRVGVPEKRPLWR